MSGRPLHMELHSLRRMLASSRSGQPVHGPGDVLEDPIDLSPPIAQIERDRADGCLVVPDGVGDNRSLPAELVEVRAEISELHERRKRLQGDLAKMLITKQTSRDAVDRLDQQRVGLNDQVTGMLGELDQIRAEAKQLIADRRQLEVYVTALRQELQALQQKRSEIVSEIQVLESVRDDLNTRPLPPQSTPRPSPPAQPRPNAAPANEPPASEDASLAEALEVVAAHRQVDLDSDTTPAEDLAFSQFFDTEIDHDKSREWILG